MFSHCIIESRQPGQSHEHSHAHSQVHIETQGTHDRLAFSSLQTPPNLRQGLPLCPPPLAFALSCSASSQPSQPPPASQTRNMTDMASKDDPHLPGRRHAPRLWWSGQRSNDVGARNHNLVDHTDSTTQQGNTLGLILSNGRKLQRLQGHARPSLQRRQRTGCFTRSRPIHLQLPDDDPAVMRNCAWSFILRTTSYRSKWHPSRSPRSLNCRTNMTAQDR